jgi:hypothetical protein
MQRPSSSACVVDWKQLNSPCQHPHHTQIDVFEFMLVFVVIQLLSPERAQHLPAEIQKTLEIVEVRRRASLVDPALPL